MKRRKFSREFKIEAVKLVSERGVSVSQACRDLDLAESVLRRWMREATVAPATAFPGNGHQRPDLAEIAALKKEVAKLKAERDILKKGETIFRHWSEDNGRTPTSRGKRHDIRIRCEASAYLAGQLDVRRAGRLSVWLPCLAKATDQRPCELRREARHGDRQEFQGQRPHLWRSPDLA